MKANELFSTYYDDAFRGCPLLFSSEPKYYRIAFKISKNNFRIRPINDSCIIGEYKISVLHPK